MANLDKFESELEDLKKEAIPALKNLKSIIESMDVSNISQIQASINSLQTAVNNLTTNVEGISTDVLGISQNVNTLSESVDQISQSVTQVTNTTNQITQNVSQLTSTVTDLSGTVTELTGSVSQITNTTIPNLQQQIANIGSSSGGGGGGTSSEENWEIFYDWQSEDPAINLNLTTGIQKGTILTENLPNITNYKKMRVYFRRDAERLVFEYDLRTLPEVLNAAGSNSYRLLFAEASIPNIIYSTNVSWSNRMGYLQLIFSNIFRLTLNNNKVVTVSSSSGGELTCFIKLELLPK